MSGRARTLLLAVAAAAAACTSAAPVAPIAPGPPHVTGTITYHQKIALPPDAVLHVKLLNVFMQGGPALTVAEQIISSPGQVPIRFDIAYDPAVIEPQNFYAVQARITVGEEVRWINDASHAVITHGNPRELEIILRQVN